MPSVSQLYLCQYRGTPSALTSAHHTSVPASVSKYTARAMMSTDGQ